MAMIDIERELETAFVIGLRTIFSLDNDFPFINDIRATKIIISGAYPEKSAELKIPQIVPANISFSMGSTSLSRNYAGDIIENGVSVGKKFATLVPYSVNLICVAPTDSQSKDLAGKVFNYLSFEYSEFFNSELKLGFSEFQKSPGGPQRIVPNKAFAHTVSVRGNVQWVGTKRPDPGLSHILEKIRIDLEKN